MRSRSIALITTVLILATLAGAPQATAAPRPLVTLPISGVTDADGTFTGALAIRRVVAAGGAVFVEGAITGTVTGPNRTPLGTVVSVPVRLPLTGNWPSGLAQAAPGQGEIVLAQASCGILNLEIGAINLDVLGLTVTTMPIAIDISGDTAGPLGALVCAILNLVGGLAGLVNLLTSLLGALGGALGGAVPTV